MAMSTPTPLRNAFWTELEGDVWLLQGAEDHPRAVVVRFADGWRVLYDNGATDGPFVTFAAMRAAVKGR